MLRAFTRHFLKSIPDAAVGGASVVMVNVVIRRAGGVAREAAMFVLVTVLCALGLALYRTLWDESEGQFD